MAEARFKVFYNNNAASMDQLDRIEQIVVEQEEDMAWEARIDIPICLDANGNWSKENEKLIKSFARVRVEIDNFGQEFVPLIDGPVVGFDSDMSSEPGQSKITLIVRDDSVYLNRDDVHDRFDDMSDEEIVTGLFESASQIYSTDIESTPSAETGLTYDQVQSESPMQILRRLARRHNKHAYVLPGPNPGESIGCFKAFPLAPDGLPTMQLLGTERNIESFSARKNAEAPASVSAATIDVTDNSVISSSYSFRDRELLGDDAALESDVEPGERVLTPWQAGSDYLDEAVAAEANRSGYAYEGSGKTMFGCYKGVLQPYRIVTVKAGNTNLSGDYLITKVIHTINRSTYEQSFNCKRDAETSSENGGSADLMGSIF